MSDLYQPDRDLARRLLGGDEAAFEHFFDTFSVATLVTSAATLPYCVSGDEHPPVEDRTNDYGTFYRIEGAIEGPIGKLSVVCIWMKQAVDQEFRFVTLKPAKGRSGNVSTTV